MQDHTSSSSVSQFPGSEQFNSDFAARMARAGFVYVVDEGERLPGGEAPADVNSSPPPTNRGVENCFHHLSNTFWRDLPDVAAFVCRLLAIPGGLENFVSTGHGARLYRQLLIGPGGVRLYADPVDCGGHCAFELPGEVVASIPPAKLQAEFLAVDWRRHVTRLDTAVDHDFFTVSDVEEAIAAGDFRSYAKRATARVTGSICGPDKTVYLGSRQSTRMLRTYSNCKHPERVGGTRSEMEYHDEKAQQVFDDFLSVPVENWSARLLAHLRDFVDFRRDWWAAFCKGVERAEMKLANWREISLERSRQWFIGQVAPVLAVLEQVFGYRWLVDELENGRAKWGPRHQLLLTVAGGAT